VHDISELETRGLPSIFVASMEFAEAARAQAHALGFDPAVVFVPHPIQDRTDQEIRALADAAVAMLLDALTAA
jgi:hypothetical protein